MKAIKRSLPFILACVLTLSFMPVTSAKASGEAWDGRVDISWYDPTLTEYYLSTPAQLAGLAALVNGMTDPECPEIIGDASYLKSVAYPNTLLVGAGGGNVSDTVYRGEIDFAYKTIYLTADMDMGGVYAGGWSGPNWTPIGGKYPLKPEVTNGDCLVMDTRFNGVLDGQGHRVSNIYCDRYAAKGFPYSMAVGLIGFLGGVPDSVGDEVAVFRDGWQPAVRNVIVGEGYIYARRMVGGVVGRVGETSNGVIIENCANFASVYNTDSKGIGGIVGSAWGTGIILNCYNAGSVTTTYACPAGGICGSNSGMSIYNCYNIGKIDSNNHKRGRGIGGHDSGTYTVANCYYLEGSDDDPGSHGWYATSSSKISVDVRMHSTSDMKTPDFIDKLNASGTVFVADKANINDGYPILYFQAQSYSNNGSYTVTLEQPASGGSISSDKSGEVQAGQTVKLRSEPDAGWTLTHFTLNGKPLSAGFFTVSADSVISAVFSEVRRVKISLPYCDNGYLSFTKSGFELDENRMVYTEDKPVSNGEILLEGNEISVRTIAYSDATPDDPSLEYTDSYTISATNAERISSSSGFRLTGEGDVTFTVTRNSTRKSWISLADTSWYTGASESYTLVTAEQLAGMAKLVNDEGVDFSGITIRLGDDISLQNTDGSGAERIWEACGRNSSRVFSGTFDGQGYSVYDMTAYSNGSYCGLFGYCVGATIKNVTVRGTVTAESAVAYAAGIVSYASNSIIENCVNRAEVRASGTGAAGIAAYISDGTRVTNSVNRASVYGTTGVGGIIGICYSPDDVIEDCQNYGEINAEGEGSYGTGGITGQLAGLMSACGNFAAVVSADRFTGGLAGYTSARIYSRIEHSVNTCEVSSSSENQRAAVGAAVGYAQYLSLENVSASASVLSGANFKSPNKGGLIGFEGTVAYTDEGEVGDDIKDALPANIPDEDLWVKPANKAPTIKAGAARPVFVRGGERISQNGLYYLVPGCAGEISISGGLEVTLDGEFGDCVSLSIRAEADSALTLNNVRLNGDRTLLALNGGVLTLSGYNELFNSSDERGNLNPTISISGNESIEGDGSLYVRAMAGNAALKLESASSLEMKSATLSLMKDGLLGEEGGALFANDAVVSISGGNLSAYSNSDYVSAISAHELIISGGIVRAHASKSPSAIAAEAVTISGGRVYCYGYSSNSSGAFEQYSGQDAIEGLLEADCVFEDILPFEDVFVSAPYFEAVYDTYKSGLLKGSSETAFSPDASMTRSMFVTLLHRVAGSPAAAAPVAFEDLTQEWYKDAVAWALEQGITEGTSALTFSPDEAITLEQSVVFLSRYYKLGGYTLVPGNGDNGKGSSPWARAAVVWAVENDILTTQRGFSETASRSDIALIISAFLRCV